MMAPAPSRRALLKFGLAGAGTLLLSQAGLPSQAAEPRAATAAEPHFFLMIVLNGGADSSYMFDARPLSMTRAGKIQNYLRAEPRPWYGRNGVTTLATSLIAPLLPFRDRFSILNGVHMIPGFDGHLQNMNFLFTGNPFGGESFVPHFNLAERGGTPASLDAILPVDTLPISVDNHSGVVPLRPHTVGPLVAKLRQVGPPQAADRLGDFMRARLAANAQGAGRFGAGTGLMLSAFDGAPQVHRKLALLAPPRADLSPEQQSAALVAECFRHEIARAAIYVTPEFFDVHAAELAKTQPKLFRDAIAKVAVMFDTLHKTPFDAKRSMLDVTTIMVTSEFGRTLRAPDAPMDNTGTNHNQFSNSILLGGKGIRPGLVIGASDLATEKDPASDAHEAMDPILEKAMGRPFDFVAMRPRADLPATFEIEQYLTIGSVVNTLYALFGVPAARHRSLGRSLPAAPVLRGLLA